MLMRDLVTSACRIAVAVGMLASPAFAGTVDRKGEDLVNVKADRVPLGQLIRELATVTPIPNLVIDPKLEKQSVTAFIEGASVAEAVRKTLEESGVQFLLWGGGAKPLGLYVGDLSKAGLAGAKGAPTAAELASMSRDERRAVREQERTEKAEAATAAAAAAVEAAIHDDDTPPADSFSEIVAGAGAAGANGAAATAQVGIGPGLDGTPAGAGGSGSAPGAAPGAPTGASTPGQTPPGLPPPVRGVATWTGTDGVAHTTGYTMQGDSVVYDDPNFVSFKNSPEARARRMNMDVSTLP